MTVPFSHPRVTEHGATAGAPIVASGDATRDAPHPTPQLTSLLAYYRACLCREAALGHLVRLGSRGDAGDGYACLPGGAEGLLSGEVENPPLPLGGEPLVDAYGTALRYGYPVVLLAPGADPDSTLQGDADEWVAAPLFVVDASTTTAGPTGCSGRPRLSRSSAPDVNPALLWAAGIRDPDELAELRRWLRAGGTPVPRLAEKARELLDRLGVDRVDAIAPHRLRDALPGAPPRAGAYNVALLYAAGPHRTSEAGSAGASPGTAASLITDLDSGRRDGPTPARVGGTALAALLGGSAGPSDPRVGDEATVPVASARLTEAQHGALRSALREPFTVVAGPPGTGVPDLVDAAVRTAAAAGQSVLVGSAEEDTLAWIVRRSGALPGRPILRTGVSDDDEAQALEELLGHRASPPGRTTTPGDAAEDWARVARAWASLDTVARTGHRLARLAVERQRMRELGWDADELFDGHPAGPAYWLERAQRALSSGFAGLSHRSAIQRELGVAPDPASLDRLCRVARVELDWRAAHDHRGRLPSAGDLMAELDAAHAAHRRSGAARSDAAAAWQLQRGRPALANRLEALNSHGGWAGVVDLLDVVPSWAVHARAARALPPTPGLFDLVIVVEADQCPVPELLPLLYRGKRALVIGDPAQPAPSTTLEPDEERRHRERAGVPRDWLERRALGYSGGSAYLACASASRSAGRRVLWLDEHDRCHPRLAGVAARACYGGRVAVTTDPTEPPVASGATPSGSPEVVRWRHIAGSCEPVLGGGGVNREEAHLVTEVLRELDTELPAGDAIGVAAPFQPQRALIRGLVRRQQLGREVRVGGAETLRGQGRGPVIIGDAAAVRTVVISPTVATGTPRWIADRALRREHVWATALTHALSSVVVVGDRTYWEGGDGVLAELCLLTSDHADSEAGVGPRGVDTAAAANTDTHTASAACRALLGALRERGARVDTRPACQGHEADLAVRAPHGSVLVLVLVLVDQTRDGPELRRLCDRGALLTRLSGAPAVRVPAWRCLHEPDRVAEEILRDH